jgi:hypothetical protein
LEDFYTIANPLSIINIVLNIIKRIYKMLIGLVGQKGVGKDTFGDVLINEYNFIKTHFADPLKEGLRHIFDLNDEQLYGKDKETFDPRWKKTPRQLFQIFGTDIMRNVMSPILGLGDELWVHRFSVWYERNKEQNIACCDVRFPNEANKIFELGGILIRIEGNDRFREDDYHVSERLIYNIPVNYVIKNNGTKEEYYEKIKLLMEKLTTSEMQQN